MVPLMDLVCRADLRRFLPFYLRNLLPEPRELLPRFSIRLALVLFLLLNFAHRAAFGDSERMPPFPGSEVSPLP